MDWQGLEKLYEAYSHELLLYLFSLSKNRELSQDLLQETFVKAYFSLSPRHKNVKAWLYFVARNLYVDSLRKEKNLHLETDELVPDENPSPEEKIIQDEKMLCLYRSLKLLEDKKREILMMQYFGHLSHREIARVLHIKSDYVRVLGLRGKKELKKRMEENGYDLP